MVFPAPSLLMHTYLSEHWSILISECQHWCPILLIWQGWALNSSCPNLHFWQLKLTRSWMLLTLTWLVTWTLKKSCPESLPCVCVFWLTLFFHQFCIVPKTTWAIWKLAFRLTAAEDVVWRELLIPGGTPRNDEGRRKHLCFGGESCEVLLREAPRSCFSKWLIVQLKAL